MVKLQLKPEAWAAVQWRGDNFAEVFELLTVEDFGTSVAADGGLRLQAGEYIKLDHWIVRRGIGLVCSYTHYNPENFETLFSVALEIKAPVVGRARRRVTLKAD